MPEIFGRSYVNLVAGPAVELSFCKLLVTKEGEKVSEFGPENDPRVRPRGQQRLIVSVLERFVRVAICNGMGSR
jgi:hypothetical protein